MNDALLWLMIEGALEKHEAQLWLSVFGVPQLEQFGERWQQVLRTLFT
jgi:transposase InsO family protein